ncbi:hypothetical protein H0274_14365 [Altererythrobacter sp. CC-YST694]|uniref:hypothetical protein n=1 Tax=Altererythrobacter sp. CC-YST694 TaxID=2755038 RepID=UPI001D0031A0|nr:hypothetical protein [Altererythrobacter sp. CC-YST694]MCB5426445.1 hypothetical protein [Altererythrobacter sp. CC-YST694]
MGILTLSDQRAAQFRRLRRRTWLLIAACLLARAADAAFGLNLIEHSQPAADPASPTCPISKETLL